MIKPEEDLELSIKALEVYPIEPAIINSMLSNLQKVVKQNCNLQDATCSFSYGELKTAFEQARCNDHSFDDWYSFNYG